MNDNGVSEERQIKQITLKYFPNVDYNYINVQMNVYRIDKLVDIESIDIVDNEVSETIKRLITEEVEYQKYVHHIKLRIENDGASPDLFTI